MTFQKYVYIMEFHVGLSEKVKQNIKKLHPDAKNEKPV